MMILPSAISAMRILHSGIKACSDSFSNELDEASEQEQLLGIA